jgi:hypothetical protein
MRKSSAITSTPSNPSTNSCMRRCQTSGALEILDPHGNLVHRNLPKGVLNVVR